MSDVCDGKKKDDELFHCTASEATSSPCILCEQRPLEDWRPQLWQEDGQQGHFSWGPWLARSSPARGYIAENLKGGHGQLRANETGMS